MRTPNERLVFVDVETAGEESWRPIMQLAAMAVTSKLQEIEILEIKLLFDESIADPRNLHSKHYSQSKWKREGISSWQAAKQLSELLIRNATVDQTNHRGEVFQVAQLVAHNAAFDSRFLSAWFDRLGTFLPASPRVLCTMQRAIWLFHEHKHLTPPADFKLPSLCEYFGVPFSHREAHNALYDVRATAALYREMNQVSNSL